MRSHHFSMIGAMAMAAMASPAIVLRNSPEVDIDAVEAVTRRRRIVSPQAPARFKRSKGAQAKPKRKPNRLHVSKRVRRKHRRAA
jgi:hypothetical protein